MWKSAPYKAELERDHQIQFDNIEEEIAQLGDLVGERMPTFCNDELTVLYAKMDEAEEEELELMDGYITRITTDGFVVFTIQNDAGEQVEFHWFESIDLDLDLETEYQQLMGKMVEIGYRIIELFDPKSGAYRDFNLIVELYSME